MNKKCSTCGAEVPENAKFCQNCGGTAFVSPGPAFQQGVSPDGMGNPPQEAVEEQPPKKKTGLVVGIVAAVLIILGVIGANAPRILALLGHYSSNDDGAISDIFSPEEDTDAAYTKGTFDGSVYTNEWADIQFTLPEGFSNAGEELYASAENDVTQCGAYFIANDTSGIIYICYEKLPAYPAYTEEQYMDAVMESLKNITSITYQLPSSYSEMTIAGNSYIKAVCGFTNEYGNFTNNVYARKLGGYIIFISAAGLTEQANDALVSQITSMN